MKTLKDYGIAILAAAAVALILRFLFIEAFRVPTSVMHPTLQQGDFILVNKWNPLIGEEPDYGEVIIYSNPSYPDIHFIKRVVGLPGDKIRIEQGRVLINGEKIPFKQKEKMPLKQEKSQISCGQEKHPKTEAYSVCLSDNKPIETAETFKVESGYYFALTDFRSERASEQTWDLVPIETIHGWASWIWLSVKPGQMKLRWKRMFQVVD